MRKPSSHKGEPTGPLHSLSKQTQKLLDAGIGAVSAFGFHWIAEKLLKLLEGLAGKPYPEIVHQTVAGLAVGGYLVYVTCLLGLEMVETVLDTVEKIVDRWREFRKKIGKNSGTK